MSEPYLEDTVDRTSANPAQSSLTETSGADSCDKRCYPPVTKVTYADAQKILLRNEIRLSRLDYFRCEFIRFPSDGGGHSQYLARFRDSDD